MATSIVTCPSCGTRNRVPVSAAGSPRCGTCRADLPWLVDAGDDDFDAAVDTSRLVIVDLWAEWCGPCRMVAPILERLSVAYAGRLKVVKVDVDRNPLTAERYNARSIPLLLVMRDGAVVEQIVGAQPEHAFRSVIDRHL